MTHNHVKTAVIGLGGNALAPAGEQSTIYDQFRHARESLGPIVELSDVVHPKLGASIGVWGFFGITPFARIGAVTDLGMFAELGLHIALPVLRR